MSKRTFEPIAPDEQISRLQVASRLLQEGRRPEAIAGLRVLTVMAPANVDAKRLLGVALNETGDCAGAETAFRAALKLQPREATLAVGLVEALIAQKKGAEAVEVLKPFVNEQTTNFGLLTWAGLALQSAGRPKEAIAMLTRATWVQPDNGVAHHNLAGAQVDDRDYAAAEREERRARALGLEAPEMLVVEGRAARGQNRFDEAIGRFAEAVRQRPTYTLAAVELAETLWVATGDPNTAFEVYDEAAKAQDPARDLARHKAKLQEEIGDREGAYATLRDALNRLETPELQIFAAQVAVYSDPTAALDHAQRAIAIAPGHSAARAALAQIYLALGEPRLAANIADSLTRRAPEDQYGWALMATSWRMLGDPRYGRLHDYERMVARSPIDTPPGWSGLDAYLADLAAELRPLHRARGHQIGQSMRRGSQTESDLARETSPAIAAFFGAIEGPIRRYMAGLGKGRDPLRGRLKADYALNGIWSVNLAASGFHVDHVHPKGWLSSACHIELPDSVATQPEGWLKFGEPGIPTSPKLEADFLVKPEPGQLVLFPSYMWHGTVPFSGSASRLSVAFDAVPA
jgi:tetratricopeptide (TPR) repeat protein